MSLNRLKPSVLIFCGSMHTIPPLYCLAWRLQTNYGGVELNNHRVLKTITHVAIAYVCVITA